VHIPEEADLAAELLLQEEHYLFQDRMVEEECIPELVVIQEHRAQYA
jgi:hypothetical protein